MTKSKLYFAILAVCSIPAWIPLVYSLVCSFMDTAQITSLYNWAHEGVGQVPFFPRKLSLDAYYQVFIASPTYLNRFWISLGLCILIVLGHLTVSCLAGYSFAKYRFRGKRLLFAIMVLFMLMPIQVMLLPNYIVLNFVQLINTYWAIILPNIFLPFGTFLLTFTFSKIPDEMIDAAKVDGAGTLRTVWSIVAPNGAVGIASLAILSFIDNWNMVEQPIVFLQNTDSYPLSVFLAVTGFDTLSYQFVCGLLCIIPVALLFVLFHKELIQSLDLAGFKL